MKKSLQKGGQNRTARSDQIPSIYGCQQYLFEPGPTVQPEKETHKTVDNYAFDLVDALSAPVLTFSQSWADTIPRRILEIIQLARLKALMLKEETATYAECVVYVYTRTLEAPMDSDWTDIYTHVTCKTLEEWFGEDYWNDTKAPKELNEWLLSKLNDLRRHIYNKRRQILKGNLNEREKLSRDSTKREPQNTTLQRDLPYAS